jgi:hypothetical protein
MAEGTDTVVLHEELAFQDVLPVLWSTAPAAPAPQALASLSERNLQILQTWDALTDQSRVELEESSPLSAELQRLDRKLMLLLDLVGQILATNRPRPAPVPVCFNALGAVWHADGPPPAPGAAGTLEIYLHECVAQPLRFAGKVTEASPAGDVTVRFLPLEDAVAGLIAKVAFRRHRRQIAGRLGPQRTL